MSSEATHTLTAVSSTLTGEILMHLNSGHAVTLERGAMRMPLDGDKLFQRVYPDAAALIFTSLQPQCCVQVPLELMDVTASLFLPTAANFN